MDGGKDEWTEGWMREENEEERIKKMNGWIAN